MSLCQLEIRIKSILIWSSLCVWLAPNTVLSIDFSKLTHFEKSQWDALFHYYQDKTLIPDKNFLLFDGQYSTELAIRSTIDAFVKNDRLVCKFPARVMLLKKLWPEVNVPAVKNCLGYQEFLTKAPADHISVVFASENLVSPMSMLGHGMLSLRGRNDQGNDVNHSVSFYLELESNNPFSMIRDSLIVGKSGVFQVAPLKRDYEYYNKREERNVWRYSLGLTQQERALLQAHMWELKEAKIPYFFDTHNCATLSLDILRVVRPDMIRDRWVSPGDLIRSIDQAGLIASVDVTPSDQWRYRMLSDVSSPRVNESVAGWLFHHKPLKKTLSETESIMQTHLATAALEFQLFDELITPTEYVERLEEVTTTYSQSDAQLDIQHYKSPLDAPGDNQLGAGLLVDDHQLWVTLRWLPIGHGIEDNNHQYFGETELKLSEFEIQYSPSSRAFRVHKFQLYSARTFTPYDTLTGGLSGALQFGVTPVYDERLSERSSFVFNGAIGLTFPILRDINVYALLNAGLVGRYISRNPLYGEPELGAFIEEIWDMKSWVSISRRYQALMSPQTRINVTQSLYWKDLNLFATFTRILNQHDNRNLYQLGLAYVY